MSRGLFRLPHFEDSLEAFLFACIKALPLTDHLEGSSAHGRAERPLCGLQPQHQASIVGVLFGLSARLCKSRFLRVEDV